MRSLRQRKTVDYTGTGICATPGWMKTKPASDENEQPEGAAPPSAPPSDPPRAKGGRQPAQGKGGRPHSAPLQELLQGAADDDRNAPKGIDVKGRKSVSAADAKASSKQTQSKRKKSSSSSDSEHSDWGNDTQKQVTAKQKKARKSAPEKKVAPLLPVSPPPIAQQPSQQQRNNKRSSAPAVPTSAAIATAAPQASKQNKSGKPTSAISAPGTKGSSEAALAAAAMPASTSAGGEVAVPSASGVSDAAAKPASKTAQQRRKEQQQQPTAPEPGLPANAAAGAADIAVPPPMGANGLAARLASKPSHQRKNAPQQLAAPAPAAAAGPAGVNGGAMPPREQDDVPGPSAAQPSSKPTVSRQPPASKAPTAATLPAQAYPAAAADPALQVAAVAAAPAPAPPLELPARPMRAAPQAPQVQGDPALTKRLLDPQSQLLQQGAHASHRAFVTLQEQYVQLQGMYMELKDQQIQGLDVLLEEQEEYIEAYRASMQKLAEHWKAEAERQAEMGRRARSAEFLAEIEALKDDNMGLKADKADLEAEVLQLKHQLSDKDARAAAAAALAAGQLEDMSRQLAQALEEGEAMRQEMQELKEELQAAQQGAGAGSVVAGAGVTVGAGAASPGANAATGVGAGVGAGLSPGVSGTAVMVVQQGPGVRTLSLQFPTPVPAPEPSTGVGAQFPSPAPSADPSTGVGLQFPSPLAPPQPSPGIGTQFPTPFPAPAPAPSATLALAMTPVAAAAQTPPVLAVAGEKLARTPAPTGLHAGQMGPPGGQVGLPGGQTGLPSLRRLSMGQQVDASPNPAQVLQLQEQPSPLGPLVSLGAGTAAVTRSRPAPARLGMGLPAASGCVKARGSTVSGTFKTPAASTAAGAAPLRMHAPAQTVGAPCAAADAAETPAAVGTGSAAGAGAGSPVEGLCEEAAGQPQEAQAMAPEGSLHLGAPVQPPQQPQVQGQGQGSTDVGAPATATDSPTAAGARGAGAGAADGFEFDFDPASAAKAAAPAQLRQMVARAAAIPLPAPSFLPVSVPAAVQGTGAAAGAQAAGMGVVALPAGHAAGCDEASVNSHAPVHGLASARTGACNGRSVGPWPGPARPAPAPGQPSAASVAAGFRQGHAPPQAASSGVVQPLPPAQQPGQGRSLARQGLSSGMAQLVASVSAAAQQLSQQAASRPLQAHLPVAGGASFAGGVAGVGGAGGEVSDEGSQQLSCNVPVLTLAPQVTHGGGQHPGQGQWGQEAQGQQGRVGVEGQQGDGSQAMDVDPAPPQDAGQPAGAHHRHQQAPHTNRHSNAFQFEPQPQLPAQPCALVLAGPGAAAGGQGSGFPPGAQLTPVPVRQAMQLSGSVDGDAQMHLVTGAGAGAASAELQPSKTMSTPGMTPGKRRIMEGMMSFFGFKVVPMAQDLGYEYNHPQSGLRFQLVSTEVEDRELAVDQFGEEAVAEVGPEEEVHIPVLHYRPMTLGRAKLPSHLQEELYVPLSSKHAFVNQLWVAVNSGPGMGNRS